MTDSTAKVTASPQQYEPPAALAATANVTAADYAQADTDLAGFWAEQAQRLSWHRQWDHVLDWSNPPFAKWFTGGQLNAAYNCLDRHLEAGGGDKVAFHWVGEPAGDTRDITYRQLHAEVCQAANALIELGVKTGDRVAIYMPVIPEAIVTMLACARLGAPHTVIFGGYSADALASRIIDCDATIVVTADGGYRRGKPSALKPAVDAACDKVAAAGHHVDTVLVVARTGQQVAWHERDKWWHEVVPRQADNHEVEFFDAEHPLYVMYTSGTTGKPKGVLHTTGGYLVGCAYTHWAVFDIKPDTDVFWCTADVGWVTGHSYTVYAPLANHTTSVIYEGTPDTPHQGRWWEIVEQYGVTILYTAPTAIRTFMRWGEDIPANYDLSSLRILGSVGEPINPEAYVWYRQVIGGDRTPVVDTWWQTETGMIMSTPLPGITAAKPGSTMAAVPGVSLDVVDDDGNPVANGASGYLVATQPWPAMLRTLWNDDERYIENYWDQWPGLYLAGDNAMKDADGDIWVLGRIDDVMNVSGHRMSTTEIESALVAHPKVAEAAVVGASDPTTGQAVCAYVILREAAGDGGEDITTELRNHVAAQIGPIARPRQVLVVPELPKTRSGKIMRRLLRDVAENRQVGDVTTLADSSVMELIAAGVAAGASD